MYINNKCAWIEWFSVPNITLESNTGLSRSGIAKARNALKQYGLIDFKPNGTKATTYKMFTMLKSEQESNQVTNTMLKSEQISNQKGNQVSNQIGVQNGNQIGGTLNKRNETNNIYFNLLKNAREKFDVSTFGGKLKAHNWASEQKEWISLTDEERLTFTANL